MNQEIKTKAELETEIYQCVGHASMCWTESPAGVFDEKEATIVSEKLMNTAIEYAKQRSIEFKNWLDKRSRMVLDEAGQMPVMFFTKFESNEQLYELFSHSIDK